MGGNRTTCCDWGADYEAGRLVGFVPNGLAGCVFVR